MTIRTYQYQVQAVVTPSAGTVINKSVTQSLGLIQQALTGNVTFNTIEHDLELTQDGIVISQPGGVSAVAQDLNLTQEVSVFGWETIEQDLGLTDEADGQSPITFDMTNNLNLVDGVQFGFKIKNEIIEQDLGLSHVLSRAVPLTVTQSLGLTDEAIWLTLSDDLNLTDLAEWGYGIDVVDTLTLTDQAARNLILNQSLSDDDIVGQAVTYFIESRCGRYEFQTFHGEGGVAPEPQRLSYKNTFLLQSLDTGDVLVLRNPETDDRRRYSFNRTSRRFFDGTLDLFATQEWITQQSQIYTIVALKRDKLDELFTFLTDNLGREVLIKDWRGQSWIGIIVNPGEVYTEDGEGYWTIDFEVEGERTPGEYVIDRLTLSDDLSRAGSIWNRSGTHDLNLTDVVGRNIEVDVPDTLTLSDTATVVIA